MIFKRRMGRHALKMSKAIAFILRFIVAMSSFLLSIGKPIFLGWFNLLQKELGLDAVKTASLGFTTGCAIQAINAPSHFEWILAILVMLTIHADANRRVRLRELRALRKKAQLERRRRDRRLKEKRRCSEDGVGEN